MAKKKANIAQLEKIQLSVAHAAAREDARPVLATVCLTKSEMVATDGLILVRRPLEKGRGPKEAILVPAELLKAVKAPNYGVAPITVESSDGQVTISCNGTSHTAGAVKGTYPDWKKLMPRGRVKTRIAFRVDVLKALLKAVGPDTELVKLEIRKPPDPVRFYTFEGGPDGAVMPVFVDWGRKKPKQSPNPSIPDPGSSH